MSNWIALAALISSFANFVGPGLSIRWHCQRDDRRHGAMQQRMNMLDGQGVDV